MAGLEHGTNFDNFFGGTEYDIFNQANPEVLNTNMLKFEPELRFTKDELTQDVVQSPISIHGPFEVQQPTISNCDGSSSDGLHAKDSGMTSPTLKKSKFITTNEFSTDSGKETAQIDSQSDLEDEIYVPFEYKGDGRKREAKKHKLQALVAQDEIMIDQMIKDYQNSNEKIIESEAALDELKSRNISKKELQSKRNRLTAQLSRDRQKLEMSFLKAMCVNYQRLLRRLEKKMSSQATKPFCQSCWVNINSTLQHHRINQIKPNSFDMPTSQQTPPVVSELVQARPINEEVEQPQLKRQKFTPAINTQADSEKLPSQKKKPSKTMKNRRQDKADSKSNKGLIGASLMLSAVGMLNYMGNQEMPVCTQLDVIKAQKEPEDQQRVAQVVLAKADLQPQDFESISANEWSLDSIREIEEEGYDDFNPHEYSIYRNMVPAKLNEVNSFNYNNQTTHLPSVNIEDAYVAFDMRESYLQRHASPMARFSDQTDLSIKDFSTKTTNMWRSDEFNLFPDYNDASCASGQQPAENLFKSKVSYFKI